MIRGRSAWADALTDLSKTTMIGILRVRAHFFLPLLHLSDATPARPVMPDFSGKAIRLRLILDQSWTALWPAGSRCVHPYHGQSRPKNSIDNAPDDAVPRSKFYRPCHQIRPACFMRLSRAALISLVSTVVSFDGLLAAR